MLNYSFRRNNLRLGSCNWKSFRLMAISFILGYLPSGREKECSATLFWHLIFCVEKLSDVMYVPPWRIVTRGGKGPPSGCSPLWSIRWITTCSTLAELIQIQDTILLFFLSYRLTGDSAPSYLRQFTHIYGVDLENAICTCSRNSFSIGTPNRLSGPTIMTC